MTALQALAAAYVCVSACVVICLYAWSTRHDDMTPLDWSLSRVDQDLDDAERVR